MTQHETVVRLWHMLDAARAASEWVIELTREDFESDLKLQSAVIYKIQLIGEAASRVPKNFTSHHPLVPWTEITGMRHILVHAYMDVDLDIVWNVAKNQLPGLITQLETILEEK